MEEETSGSSPVCFSFGKYLKQNCNLLPFPCSFLCCCTFESWGGCVFLGYLPITSFHEPCNCAYVRWELEQGAVQVVLLHPLQGCALDLGIARGSVCTDVSSSHLDPLQDHGEAGKGNSGELSMAWQIESSSAIVGCTYWGRAVWSWARRQWEGGEWRLVLVPYSVLPFLYIWGLHLNWLGVLILSLPQWLLHYRS